MIFCMWWFLRKKEFMEDDGNKKTTNHVLAFGQYWIDFRKYCGLSKKAESIFYQSDIPMEPTLYMCSVYSSIWEHGQGEGAIWIDGERAVLQNFIAFPPP
ncbi:unnamed protein product [Owenia fusiformis]|uniref:Uncharacterized protein n=1 Tax=Owenia fusiformis TaxID=6347 RepID=A0A8S4QB10_OWEFU|nr:unnamed protein product [Owenia fusiformis]